MGKTPSPRTAPFHAVRQTQAAAAVSTAAAGAQGRGLVRAQCHSTAIDSIAHESNRIGEGVRRIDRLRKAGWRRAMDMTGCRPGLLRVWMPSAKRYGMMDPSEIEEWNI